MSKIQQAPRYTIIEQTALALAATWYEVGRSQGLTSKHKTARHYAAHNLEKFIPKATDYLIDMLGRNDVSVGMKEEIYGAFSERHNDPELLKIMPNVDVKKVLEFREMMERKKAPIEIKTSKELDNGQKQIAGVTNTKA